MAETEMNADREHRIEMEIVVDAHGPEGRMMGETRPCGPFDANLRKEGE